MPAYRTVILPPSGFQYGVPLLTDRRYPFLSSISSSKWMTKSTRDSDILSVERLILRKLQRKGKIDVESVCVRILDHARIGSGRPPNRLSSPIRAFRAGRVRRVLEAQSPGGPRL